MSEKYFSLHKEGHDINVNLNLTDYATKGDLKNLNADTSSFALKINLGHLKDKVDTINDSKRLFETGRAELISVTLFNSIRPSIDSLRSINDTEINDYIENTVLNKIADVVNSIKNNPLKSETRSKIKSLVDEFQAKITDIFIREEGGLVVKSDFDTELKKIREEIKNLKSS